jgi:chitodextrinase
MPASIRRFSRLGWFALAWTFHLIAANGYAQVAFVQSAYSTPQTPQTVVTVSNASAQTAGSLNVVVVGWNDSTAHVTGVTDTKGNTYLVAVGPTVQAGVATQAIYYAKNIRTAAAGANKVTVTFDRPARYPDVRVAEYRGIDPVNALDVAAAATGSSTSSASGAATTTNATDLLIGANVVQTGTAGPGSSYTTRVITSPDGDILEDRVVNSTGSYTATAAVSPSGAWIMQMVAFRAAGTGGADTTLPTVSVSAPTLNATVAGTSVTVSANAADNVGVAGVQFLLDGAALGVEDTTAPYSATWNTTAAANGSHRLSARARGAAGNLATAADVPIVVDNQAPAGTVVINGGAAVTNSLTATLTLAAIDALGPVTQMRFSNTGASYNAALAYASTASWTLSTGTGTKTVYAQFEDAAGNWSTGVADTIVLDTTAPTISNRAVGSITPNSAIATWTTNEPATSQVEYGLTTSYGSTTALDASLLTAHGVSLVGLGAGTVYHYRIRTKDAAGNEAVSPDGTFPTIANQDTTPPSMPTNLSATAMSTSQINLSWSASSDNVGIAGYTIFRGGVQIATSASTNFSDTGLAASTLYSYTVAAFDAAANVSAQSRALNVTTQSMPPPSGWPVFPLKVGATGRYLVDQNDVPFLMTGDSPQGLIADLSLVEAETYFANREAKGINVVQIHLLAGPTFGGRSDFSTADGITPFTTSGDLSTPREAYFARVDAILALANTHHMTVMLTAAETIDALDLFRANGEAKSRAFGRYLGARYASTPNVIWNYGNDFQTWRTASDNAVILAVCDGIKDFDSSHIQTIWLDYLRSASRDSTDWDSRITLDFAYTYYPPYELILTEYAKAPAKPVFMGESNYEGEALRGYLTTPFVVRKQNYWSLLSGATGTFYCNHTTWGFPSAWQASLESPGVNELAHLIGLFGAYPWWTLVPDTTHAALTAGYGTYAGGTTGSIDTNDYVTAARAPDGSLFIAYLPTSRTVTMDMTKLAGATTARWYDPTDGSYTSISGGPFANLGAQQFSPPAGNSAGDSDWILVLEASVGPDTTVPSTPTALSGASPSPSQVTLAWAASSDNVGVAGYSIFRDGLPVGTSAVAAFVDSGLIASRSYAYNVSAFDAAGNVSARSSPLAVTTQAAPDTTPPSVPASLLSSNVSSTSVSVSWSPSSDNVAVAGYSVYRNGTQVGLVALPSYSDSGLVPSTTYTYTVAAFDAAGNRSAQSSGLVVTTQATQTSITIGETQVAAATDSGNGNLLLAQQATLTQAATLVSLSFYVTTAAGNLRLGVYDATGPGGGPGAKIAETNSITPVVGWNTANVTSPRALSPGIYWLAYSPSSSSLAFRVDRSSGTLKWYPFTFATLPGAFSTTPTTEAVHFSFYATFVF